MAVKTRIEFSRDRMVVHREGHKPVKVSISRFPRLATASPEARSRYTLAAEGTQVVWPDLEFVLDLAVLK